ncbi:hypothetical protein KNE206_07400 [Kitasatospora sp. NE20-6]|uniref:hypothetical protein n=1 Tax=Kitasatospora sp. NE20-6 TaxID=2859066 RepID=UPI0034DC3935
MLSKRLVPTAVVCVLLAAGATACSSGTATPSAAPSATPSAAPSASPVPTLAVDTLSAKEISGQAHAAMKAVTAMKAAGTFTSEGSVTTVDLAADMQGNCAGTIGHPGKGTAEVLRTGTTTWLKPDEAFWKDLAKSLGGNEKQAAVAAQLFKGRWFTGDGTGQSLTETVFMCGMVKAITGDDGADEVTSEKGTAGTTGGVKTFSIVVADAEGTKTTLHIATEGKPYLVAMEQKEGDSPAELTFSDFDKPVTVQKPAADQVVDLAAFEQQLKKG